jgi:hypothetical protein
MTCRLGLAHGSVYVNRSSADLAWPVWEQMTCRLSLTHGSVCVNRSSAGSAWPMGQCMNRLPAGSAWPMGQCENRWPAGLAWPMGQCVWTDHLQAQPVPWPLSHLLGQAKTTMMHCIAMVVTRTRLPGLHCDQQVCGISGWTPFWGPHVGWHWWSDATSFVCCWMLKVW